MVLLVAFTGGKGKPIAAPSATASPSSSAPAEVACGGKVPKAASVQKKQYQKPPKMTIDTNKKYVVTMVTSCGTIKMELDPKLAPNTVNSLVFLVNEKFYDGLIFHRIVKNFVIQGGDPGAGGVEPGAPNSGGPGYSTVDVPPSGVSYKEGDVAMAKTQTEPSGTAGSQFFIVTGDPAALNANPTYALVGHLLSGLEVAKQIEQLPTTVGGAQDGQPAQTVYIVKVTVKVQT